MYGSNFGNDYGAYQQQQYQSPAAQRAYQQIGNNGYQQPQYTQPPSINPGFAWVSSDDEVRSFIVVPGGTVLLMNTNAKRFYIKSADQSGIPNTRTFTYEELSAGNIAPQPDINTQYVTRAEYDTIVAGYQELADKINKLLTSDTKRRKVVLDNEESPV